MNKIGLFTGRGFVALMVLGLESAMAGPPTNNLVLWLDASDRATLLDASSN